MSTDTTKKSKITILHIISSAGIAGGERYLLDLIRYSDKSMKHIVALPYEGQYVRLLKNRGFLYSIISMEGKFSLKPFGAIVGLIRDNKVNITHTHGYRANFYGRMASIFTEVKNISTVHVSLFDYMDTPLLMRYLYMFLERILSFKASKFICVSTAMEKDILRLGIEKNKIALIPNGVDLNRFLPRPKGEQKKGELGIPIEAQVIGTIGRMVSEKGQVYLIEALKYLRSEWKNLKCLFVGDGPLRSQLMQMARDFGIEEMCVFTGICENIEDIYSILDIFVLPSIREPFGIVLLEAMATGIPVIATGAGGPLDIIRSDINGILVPPKNSYALAKAISRILKDKKLARALGLSAREKVEQEFSVQKMVGKTEKVYLSLLKAG